jgi:hypothetical protein
MIAQLAMLSLQTIMQEGGIQEEPREFPELRR